MQVQLPAQRNAGSAEAMNGPRRSDVR